MVANADHKISHVAGKIVTAVGTVGIIEPQRLSKVGQSVAGDGPVRNVVVYLRGPHVIEVLRIVCAAQRGCCAVELPRLVYRLREGHPRRR